MRLAPLSRPLLIAVLAAATVATALVPALIATAPTAAAAAAAAPGTSNTGVPAGARLTRMTGQVTLSRAGATYTNLDIYGRVRVTAPNITLANSIVRGDASRIGGQLIDVNSPTSDHHGFVLRDSTLVPQYRSIYQNGIVGHDFTVLRCNITGTVDAIQVAGGNASITQSWLHDTYHVTAAQSPDGRETHNDGVQVLSGANVTISGNTIANNSNSALQITQDAGPVSNVRFTDNWSSGGACTVNMVAKPRTSMAGITVSGNRFLHDTRVANCAIIWGAGVTVSYPGNIWSDTGKAVVPSRGY